MLVRPPGFAPCSACHLRSFAPMARARAGIPFGSRSLPQAFHVKCLCASGEAVVVGQRRLLLAEGVSVAPAEDVLLGIEGAGRTALLVAIDGIYKMAEDMAPELRGQPVQWWLDDETLKADKLN